jgi:hypothetical protein
MDDKREAALQRDVDHARMEQVRLNERLTLLEHRVLEVATELGKRGLVDLADDLRMACR